MRTRKPIELSIGDRVENIRADWRKDDGSRSLKPGDVGDVVEVRPPIQGTGQWIDDVQDEGRDGHAIVVYPDWGRSVVWPSDDGRSWRRVKEK